MDKIKLVVTITDASHMVHVGGPLESRSGIITLKKEQVPPMVFRHLERKRAAQDTSNRNCFETISFSLLEDDDEP
jgi:hypothetical protein